jgi:hypothetical protein
MNKINFTQHNKRLRTLWLVISMTLAALTLAFMLWGAGNTTPALADPGDLYVDGATGADTPACGTTVAPCQTISYTLNTRAVAGDVIRVAQGVYTENLTINISVTLEGGYEAAGWTRDISLYETIIDGAGTPTVQGDWDEMTVRKPGVILDGAEFKMWYDGVDTFGETQIGMATSSDGISWTKSISNPVIDNSSTQWDDLHVERAPFVLKEDKYKMWFEADNEGRRELYYAHSTDGISWTLHGDNPVLAAGPEGYDQEAAAHGSVLNDGGVYKLWYHAVGDQGPIIAYATSPDETTWTKQGPVLLPQTGEWDEFALWGPSVLKLSGMYWMWYAANGPQGPLAIGVVTSTNGITWTRFLNTPVLTDTTRIGDPHVISDSGKLKMWYQDFDQGVINYAESNDGINWTPSISNPVLTQGAPTQWGGPVVYVPGGDSEVVLDGFTITGGSAQLAGGVHTENHKVTIQNCVVRDNFASGAPDSQGAGGVLSTGDQLVILDSQIVANQVGQGAGGVRVHQGTLVLSNTIVADNRGDMGVNLNGATTLMNATVTRNDGGVQINTDASKTLTITNSIIYNTAWSLLVEGNAIAQITYSDIEGGWTGEGNINENPWFVDPENGDYHLQPWSPAIDSGTGIGTPDHDFEGDSRPLYGGIDMGADEYKGPPAPYPNEGNRYVATTGTDAGPNLCLESANPCQTIGHAIGVAVSGDTVLVAAGTYTENVKIYDKNLTVRGGYTPAYLRSGGETIVDGGGVNRTFHIHGSDSVLENLTITGGDTPDDQCWGGGIWITNGNLTIRSSKVIDNWADCSGGGMEVNNDWGPAHLVLEDTIVMDNYSGGQRGGVSVWHTSADLVNVLIADNQSVHDGSGMGIEDGEVSILNSTIAGNTGGTGLNIYDTFGVLETTVIQNSIVWGNTFGDLSCGPGICTATYSDIAGGWTGKGNIDEDPQFVGGGDYHLLGNSPVIDEGDPAIAPPTDLEGTPRDIDPDMGAYEYQRFDHDIAVVDASPDGILAVNQAYPVNATVYNTGNMTENNVAVKCTIKKDGSTVYQQTVNTGSISSLTWEVLVFPNFTPTAMGEHTLTCESQLAGDQKTANDSVIHTLTVQEFFYDVWTKDNPEDDGEVPSDLDGWYESPDLWVRNNPDGGLIHQDPIKGITNTVYVRLRNGGTGVISGTVNVYWIEPSLGVRCGNWAYIGTITFNKLLPNEVRIVSTPWVPTRTGHTCLQDVIDSPQDPYNRGLECSPLWVPWDNNVEWHNVNIIENPGSNLHGVAGVKTADARLVNVYNLPKDVDLVIERRTFPTNGTMTIELPDDLFDRWYDAGGTGNGIEVYTATKEIVVTSADESSITDIPMKAAEEADILLIFEAEAGLEFETALREEIDGLTVGGIAYQWVIPDTTPPEVAKVSPDDGTVEVATDAPLVITFDEPVSPLNFDLVVTPDPGGWNYYWNDDSTVVTATHNAFTEAMTYSATVTAKDGSLNAMETPYTWDFTVERFWLYLPLINR